MSQCKFKYVVATSIQEAQELVSELGFDNYKEADAKLHEIRMPPTDPFYAIQYRVFAIRVNHE